MAVKSALKAADSLMSFLLQSDKSIHLLRFNLFLIVRDFGTCSERHMLMHIFRGCIGCDWRFCVNMVQFIRNYIKPCSGAVGKMLDARLLAVDR